MRRFLCPLAASAAFALFGCASGSRSRAGATPIPASVTAGFIVRLGSDTVSVERYSRTASRLEGDVVVRSPRTRLGHYAATLASDSTVAHFEFEIHPVGSVATSRQSQAVAMRFDADSITVETRVNDSTAIRRIAATGPTLPYLAPSLALSELLTMRARAALRDTTDVSVIPVGAAQRFPVRLVRVGTDSVTIAVAGSTTPARARVDPLGRLLGQQALASTQKFVAERVPTMNIDSLARAFASREMGAMSPKDSVTAAVAGAHISVVYSRPSVRRRTIFGGVVPFGEVWRTGANAATVFRTDVPIVLGGTAIPRGAYTLWTIPRRDGWTLIVNKQVGQWGTEYKPDADLARIPMAVAPLGAPVERFTISVRPQGVGGVLAMSWETTQATVAIAAP